MLHIAAKRQLLAAAAGEEEAPQRTSKLRRVAAEAAPPADEEMTDAGDLSAGPGSASKDGSGVGMEVDAAAPPFTGKRPFLDMLQDNMQRRRKARLSGTSPLAELLREPAPKRRKPAAPSPSPPLTGGKKRSASARHAASEGSEPDSDPRAVLWEPPVSPFGLLEEEIYDDPWKVLVACMLLNKTTATQVRKVIWELFEMCPTPEAALAADVGRIEALIQPLGLFRKRAVAVQRLSDQYLNTAWRDPAELYGIGEYAAQAYWIFCRGRWRDVRPADKDLRRYVEWLRQTNGEGSGLSRHRTQPGVQPDV